MIEHEIKYVINVGQGDGKPQVKQTFIEFSQINVKITTGKAIKINEIFDFNYYLKKEIF